MSCGNSKGGKPSGMSEYMRNCPPNIAAATCSNTSFGMVSSNSVAAYAVCINTQDRTAADSCFRSFIKYSTDYLLISDADFVDDALNRTSLSHHENAEAQLVSVIAGLEHRQYTEHLSLFFGIPEPQ